MGAVFIDLFAGSGAVGIEALSRGAGKVIFADNSSNCCAVIHDNLKLLGASSRDALVLNTDLAHDNSMEALRDGLKRLGEIAADVIFADPPYSFDGIESIPSLISGSFLCAAEAVLVVEHGKKVILPQNAGAYVKFRDRNYGDSSLSFYNCQEESFQFNY